ncbi:uncharacterized protein N7477_009044 [Penicillium maclennaniae]|uniref:uncharacterized protein n=1 Tax=Penicillium maclennaniae TaxID=1343394 RepID=UPI00254010FB|nr:uncharacterized protein N7477_009044 [Penicillium maclennaniae]KAJ5661428.1 hypothetical protein N7477_009044 [Penicillium maclennaniae]
MPEDSLCSHMVFSNNSIFAPLCDRFQPVSREYSFQVGTAAGAAHAGVKVAITLALGALIQVEGPPIAVIHEGKDGGQVDHEEGGSEVDGEGH